MSVIALIMPVVVIAFLVWLLLQIPAVKPFANIVYGVAIFCVVIFLLQAFGVPTGLPHLYVR